MSRASTPPAAGAPAADPFQPLSLPALLTLVARHLAVRPDAVFVREQRTESTVLLELDVADEDRGRMIGKEGKMLACLRSLATSIAARENLKAHVEVVPGASG